MLQTKLSTRIAPPDAIKVAFLDAHAWPLITSSYETRFILKDSPMKARSWSGWGLTISCLDRTRPGTIGQRKSISRRHRPHPLRSVRRPLANCVGDLKHGDVP